MSEQQSKKNLWGMLSDEEIVKRLDDKDDEFWIEPLLHSDSQITGCKVDVHLSGTFYEVKQSAVGVYDPLSEETVCEYRRKLTLPLGMPYTLHPNIFVLAPTFESISMPDDLVGILEGRSSLGRLGIIIHATACFIDPGYKGTITLELSNLGQLPVKLYTLSRVATVSFMTIRGKVRHCYGSMIPYPPTMERMPFRHGKYDSVISQPSKFHEDWEHDVLREYVNSKLKKREEPS